MEKNKEILLNIPGQITISAITDGVATETPGIRIQTRLAQDIILTPEQVEELMLKYYLIKN